MARFSKGDDVRIDIPDKADPDYSQYHGVHGTIVSVLEDDANTITGDEQERFIYRIELESGETADFRWRDLRPPNE